VPSEVVSLHTVGQHWFPVAIGFLDCVLSVESNDGILVFRVFFHL